MQKITLRKYDLEALIKFVILLGFALFFLITLLTGKTQLYVHPRIVPYIEFSIAAMLIISGFIFFDIFKPSREKPSVIPYLIFLVPLILAFSLPAKSMDSSSMPYDEIKIGQQSVSTNNSVSMSDNTATANPVNSANPNIRSLSAGKDSETQGNSLKLQGDTIVIDDSNFYKWTEELYEHMDKYNGKKLEVIGFVLKDTRMKENEFVPARFMMVCCTADMQPIGLLCQYTKASELKKDSWVKVTGTIKKSDYEGQQIPLFIANSVTSAEKPRNEYVYPY
jgi:putative membrane protein